ncbi:hypothetical protein [Helicobacter trogontum]|uniref:hypothetical protein n=1 Tax=Helicobacter trogontum TaxID=50960 RepID=UPI000CF0A99C|nr:hypothetical protein [Helicobacter trogontum]
MSETQINELKRDLKDKGEIIKSLTESNNNLIVNQQITALAIKELQERLAEIENAIKDKACKGSNEMSNFDLDDFIFELSCNIESAICLYFEAITCQNKETMENMLRIEMLKAIETTREKLEARLSENAIKDKECR